ncbi:MAG: phage tail protein [Nocardioides sp.]
MAGEAGKVVGRISVKVIPDTSDFRRILRRDLKKIQDDFRVKIRVELDKASAQRVVEDLDELSKKNRTADIDVDLNGPGAKVAQARMAAIARTRTARIIPLVDKAAAAKAAGALGTIVAAASGGRVVGKFMRSLIDTFKELDTLAPKIGAVGIGILNLTAGALSLSSNLFALSSSLASIGALALPLPAAFVAAGIGIGVLVAAFKDFNTVLPEVAAKFSELQNLISSNFWSKAEAPMRTMIDQLLPRFSAGLGLVATKFGSFFGELSTALSNSLSGPAIAGMFDSLGKSIDIAKGAAVPLAGIIRSLGEQGAAYLPRMSKWVVDIANSFDQWLYGIGEDGSLARWVENGLTALSDLGRAAKSAGSILSGIADAAQAAGGSSLGIMADALERVATVVNSPAFQGGMVAAFRGAHEAMDAIAKGAGPQLASFFTTLGYSLGQLLPIAGQALGTALGGIATALNELLKSGGVQAFLGGIAKAMEAMAPAMGPVGKALGEVGKALGAFVGAIGPVLGTVLTALANAFSALLPAITPLLPILGGALLTVVRALSPVLAALAPIIGQLIVQAVTALVPIIGQLVSSFIQLAPLGFQLIAALMPLVPQFLAMAANLIPLVQGLTELALQVLPQVISGLTAVMPYLLQFMQAQQQISAILIGVLIPVLKVLVQVGLIPLRVQWAVLMAAISAGKAVLTAIGAAFRTVFGAIRAIVTGFIGAVRGAWSAFMGALRSIASGGLGAIRGLFSSAWTTITSGARTAWEGVKSAFSAGISGAVSLVQGLPGRVQSAVGNIGGILVGAGRAVIDGFISGLEAGFGPVRSKLAELTLMLPDWKGPAPLDRKILTPSGVMVMEGFLRGLESQYDTIRRSLGGFTSEISGMEVAPPRIAGAAGMASAAVNGALSTEGPVPAQGNDIDINLYGSDVSANDVADEILHATRRVELGGRYAGRTTP